MTTSLRRGFKAEAEWLAKDVRKDLGLAFYKPICPIALAERCGLAVQPLSEYHVEHPLEVLRLRAATGPKGFSAVTVCGPEGGLVIYNDGHAPTRQAADIAHECAHALLHHKPQPLVGTNGARHYDKVCEDEANWLGPALLVSYDAAFAIVRAGEAVDDAAGRFGVSASLMGMRIRVTGVRRRVSYAA